MSYAMSAALQEAVFERLSGDADLAGLVGKAIHDGVPAGPLPGLYVSLGEEVATDRSDATGAGAWHDFEVAVVSDAGGFAAAKRAAAAVSDALLGAPLTLSRGRLVGLWFRKATAKRVQGGDLRRIDLRFRAQVSDEI